MPVTGSNWTATAFSLGSSCDSMSTGPPPPKSASRDLGSRGERADRRLAGELRRVDEGVGLDGRDGDLRRLDHVRRDDVADGDVLRRDEDGLPRRARASGPGPVGSGWLSRITIATKASTASSTPTRMTRRFDRFTRGPLMNSEMRTDEVTVEQPL